MQHIKSAFARLKSAACAVQQTSQAQVTKRQTRYEYMSGPMFFLAQQIVRAMQDAGYPAFIWCHYRPPEQQQIEFDEGDSRARPWRSAHQFLEAVDIVHPKLYWDAPLEYWQTLNSCVRIVEEKFSVDLVHGYDWGWDSAHIELADWREFRDTIGHATPTVHQCIERFKTVLPKQWKQFERSAAYPLKMANPSFHATAFVYPHKP